MDIVGYVFLGIAAIALILGIANGFANTLFGLLAAVGSIAVSALLTPTVSELEFIKNMVEDTPIVINGQEMFFLRTAVVFLALFVLSLVVLLAVKGLFNALLKRAKVLKILDKLLGAVFGVALVWMIFGILFSIANAGTEWLVAIDEQLASSGVDIGLAKIFGNALTLFSNSEILKTVYSSFNPIGDLVGSMLFA